MWPTIVYSFLCKLNIYPTEKVYSEEEWLEDWDLTKKVFLWICTDENLNISFKGEVADS